MKKGILILTLAILAAAVFFVQNSFSHSNSAPVMDCASCHQGDMKGDMVSISGIPKTFKPGSSYKLTLKIKSDLESMGESRGGFALEATGGKIVVSDKKNTQFIERYLTHTLEGSKSRVWNFTWQAPKTKDDVTITVMAVSSNGDYSPFGDEIGAQSYTIKAANK